MVNIVDTASIQLWGHEVGAVSWLNDRQYAVFEYQPGFQGLGLDIAPLRMPVSTSRQTLYSFPALNRETYKGLPGLLADALPDKFGNAVIDAWLARQGRSSASFSPVERLCYTGNHGMGALEFTPAVDRSMDQSVAVEIDELVSLAQDITQQRDKLSVNIGQQPAENADAINDILRVGTSAGGARPKAIIAVNEQGQVRSGQVQAPAGYDYWIIKFDGVNDLGLGAPKSYGRIEFTYYLMALDAGIQMSECRLLEENNRAHFMTRRFDRSSDNKLHMQSLCGIAHFDFNMPGAYSYEQAFGVMRQLRLSKLEAEQQYRRMLFNVIGRNQDDHTKNIAFLMDRKGQWQLSPAYDLTYAHNPAGQWTNQHQMSINGKRDHFTREDLIAVGENISLPHNAAIIDEIKEVISQWPRYAEQAGITRAISQEIEQSLRLGL